MESPTGIIPEELMYPQKIREVVEWLKQQPFYGDYKAKLLRGWAVTVRVSVRQRDYAAVERTGIDY